jgi:predicted MFS family arabinose efflux permease
VTPVPLRRNRDFLLLQAGRLLSSSGSQITSIAYPLLALALTGSPAKAGIVGFASLLPFALFSLPAGLAADRWNRKWLMIAADLVRLVAMAALAGTIALDHVEFWMLPLTAFVQGGASSFVSAASAGAMRAVVPMRQLPAASAVVTGRDAAISLAAPPLGGALLGVARSLPFVAAVVSYGLAALALFAMRTPFQEQRERDLSSARSRLAEGFRFLWHHDFIRTCAFLFGLANFVGPGVLLAIVVIGRSEGLSGGEVGALLAAFGVCILVGSFLSPLVRRVLPVRGVLLLELWTWPGCALFLIWPNVYVLTASILPTALVIPSTNSVVDGYQLAMTPDRLVGRVEGVRLLIALVIAPLGPLTAGFLLEAASERATIAVFAAFGVVLAVWGTLSPAVRSAPNLNDLVELSDERAAPATTG